MAKKEFARNCTECGAGMNEGYCFDGGRAYYCSDACLHKHFTHDEWKKLYADGEGDSYWTEWEDEMSDSEYSYEKEEGLYQAERLIKELQNNSFAINELLERMERVRADWKKGLGDPQSFDEWDSHFTAAINKAMEAA